MRDFAKIASWVATTFLGISLALSAMLGVFYFFIFEMVLGSSGHPSVVDTLGSSVHGVFFFSSFGLPIILAPASGLALYFQFRTKYIASITVTLFAIVLVMVVDTIGLGHIPRSFSDILTTGQSISRLLFPETTVAMSPDLAPADSSSIKATPATESQSYSTSNNAVIKITSPNGGEAVISPTDISANWKTYTNATYGYHIKYPSDWKVSAASVVSNGKDQEIWITRQDAAGSVDKKIVILAAVDSDGNLPFLRTAPITSQATIAGIVQTAYVFPTQSGCKNDVNPAYWCSYFDIPINHGGVWYDLTASYGADAYTGIYKDILSTFGFAM